MDIFQWWGNISANGRYLKYIWLLCWITGEDKCTWIIPTHWSQRPWTFTIKWELFFSWYPSSNRRISGIDNKGLLHFKSLTESPRGKPQSLILGTRDEAGHFGRSHNMAEVYPGSPGKPLQVQREMGRRDKVSVEVTWQWHHLVGWLGTIYSNTPPVGLGSVGYGSWDIQMLLDKKYISLWSLQWMQWMQLILGWAVILILHWWTCGFNLS